jgi:hypothetical protein
MHNFLLVSLRAKRGNLFAVGDCFTSFAMTAKLDIHGILDILSIGWEESLIATLASGHGTGFMAIVMIVSGRSSHELAASGHLDFLAHGFVGLLLGHKILTIKE